MEAYFDVICSIRSDPTRVGNNGNLCGDSTACGSGKKKIEGPLMAAIIIPIVVVIALFVTLVLLLQQKLKKKAEGKISCKDEMALLQNREFSYRELKNITNNFGQEIGKGGFGAVFLGHLENGNPVAVKLRSNSSSQGGKEFLAEVEGNQFEAVYVSQHYSYSFP